jgi:hypothetical protein
MPPRAKELTTTQIKGLSGTKPIRVAVGGVAGLHIQIWPSGDKSWVLRTQYSDWVETKLSNGTIQHGRKKRDAFGTRQQSRTS